MSNDNFFSADIFAQNNKTILALGAESAGNFSVFQNGKIYLLPDFGDLLDEKNFLKFKESVMSFLSRKKIKPNIVLTDLHPLFKTTEWGKELAQKYQAEHISVQHHLAHIFSAFGEDLTQNLKNKIPKQFFGLALDGTGYGLDEKIWGGEIFKFNFQNKRLKNFHRIGHLENQIMIGSELAIHQPARMLIAILNKFPNPKDKKDFVYNFVKKYYSRNQFELLDNQFRQNFNCLETSSAGRILDAASLLLGFCGNQRRYKHEATNLLEKNSTQPYKIKPRIIKQNSRFILQTTFLFEFLIKNLYRDRRRLAATAQFYLAQGMKKIIQSAAKQKKLPVYFAGGITNNQIIASQFNLACFRANQQVSRGDAGISFGQIIWTLLRNRS